MRRKYEKILSTLKTSPFPKIIKLGFQPEEIKEAIIELLEPYFENKDILKQFAIEVLAPESVSFLKLQKNQFFLEMFKKSLLTYRSAKSKDPQNCFESCALWSPHILDSLHKYWSIFHLEVDKSSLEIEEFLHESLRTIGEIIEGVTKPYLKVLLHQVRILNGIASAPEDINSLDLGVIVNELIRRSGYADLFAPPPWSIKLNQWRNIAYHHTAKIENNEFVCWYGKAPNVKEIRLSKNALLQVVQTIFKIYNTLKLSYTLFYVDNIKEINKFSSTIKVRDDALFVNFATGLASQGFEIVKYNRNADEAKLVVKDLSDLDPNVRRAHASQFLFPLWLLTRSRKVIVEYREKDNTPNLLVSTNSAICEKIYSGKFEALTLAKRMNMVDLKTGKIIPVMKNNG